MHYYDDDYDDGGYGSMEYDRGYFDCDDSDEDAFDRAYNDRDDRWDDDDSYTDDSEDYDDLAQYNGNTTHDMWVDYSYKQNTGTNPALDTPGGAPDDDFIPSRDSFFGNLLVFMGITGTLVPFLRRLRNRFFSRRDH